MCTIVEPQTWVKNYEYGLVFKMRKNRKLLRWKILIVYTRENSYSKYRGYALTYGNREKYVFVENEHETWELTVNGWKNFPKVCTFESARVLTFDKKLSKFFYQSQNNQD